MMRKLQTRQCEGYTVEGVRCQAHALPDSTFCWQHAKSPEERKELSRKAAEASVRVRRSRKEANVPEDNSRVDLENDLYREVERVVRAMFAAKLPGTNETDFSLAATAAFISWLMYDMPEEFEGFARRVLPRDIAHRAAEAEATARRELNASLREYGFEELTVEKVIEMRADGEHDRLLRLVGDATIV
jgi:hypothetical protein